MGARLLALQALELQYHPDFRRRWALADEALALARETGDATTLAQVLWMAWGAYWSAQTLELRSALATELAECAEGASSAPQRLYGGGGV